eukprot:jgi/Ulvmu1/12085/UM084_0008.1
MMLARTAILLITLAVSSALTIQIFPPTDFKCQDDCCITGTSCCGAGCIPTNQLPFTLCENIPNGCCNDPDNECAPENRPSIPLPPADDPNDDSECCGSGEECCNGECKPKREQTASGIIAVCFSNRGCCPPPPPSDECGPNCCQPGLDCVCGGCTVWDGFPVLCAAGSGTCCEDPKNPCATDVPSGSLTS